MDLLKSKLKGYVLSCRRVYGIRFSWEIFVKRNVVPLNGICRDLMIFLETKIIAPKVTAVVPISYENTRCRAGWNL